MRALLFAAGSRGDFQPMLALALGLQRRGHTVRLAAPPNFAAEASAFGVSFSGVGRDVQAWLARERGQLDYGSRLGLMRLVTKIMIEELESQFDALVPLVHETDILVSAGVAIAAASVAEAAGIPYAYVVYTPQMFPSAHHPPAMAPFHGLPRFGNRMLWYAARVFYDRLLRAPVNRRRHGMGLTPIEHVFDFVLPRERTLLAADPEVSPAPPDCPLISTGALALPDERPLPRELLRFLSAGDRPIYIGFGSMPDEAADKTTRIIGEAVSRVGCRAVLSSGWAGLGAGEPVTDTFVAGPVSHSLLFPMLAGAVHHGGAGTTAACARAGIPQLVVPHGVDQFGFARSVLSAGLGPKPIPRGKLSADRLVRGMSDLLKNRAYAERASVVGASIRARDSVRMAAEVLEQFVEDARGEDNGPSPRSSNYQH